MIKYIRNQVLICHPLFIITEGINFNGVAPNWLGEAGDTLRLVDH